MDNTWLSQEQRKSRRLSDEAVQRADISGLLADPSKLKKKIKKIVWIQVD